MTMHCGIDWLFVFDIFKNDFVNFAKEEKSLFMWNSLNISCKSIYKLNLVIKVINEFDCINSSGKSITFGYKNQNNCGIMKRIKSFVFVPKIDTIFTSTYTQSLCSRLYGISRRYKYKFNVHRIKTSKGYITWQQTLKCRHHKNINCILCDDLITSKGFLQWENASKCYHRTNSKCIMCANRVGRNALYWWAFNKK